MLTIFKAPPSNEGLFLFEEIMGIPLFSKSSYDVSSGKMKPITGNMSPLPNPNPRNFQIIKSEKIGKFLVLLINYPDCTNYEGNKISIYEGISLEKLVKQGSLDPHFSNNKKFHSPIARFVPDDKGWQYAVNFCRKEN